MDYVIKMEHISKSFSGVKVLDDVNFFLKPGEVHALMGENGAGKSTLVKILSGIYAADAGTITMNGSEIQVRSVHDAMGQGIALIHQEICVVPEMTVAENMYLGNMPQKYGFVKKAERLERAKKVWDELKLDIDLNAKLKDLNIAQQQMVEIATALTRDIKVLIMDEPTSSLSNREIEALFEQIRRIRDKGTSIIYISHRMEETFRICDSITVLRDGKFAGSSAVKDIDEEGIIRMMVGRELDEKFHTSYRPVGGEPVLQVRGLTTDVVEDISFDLRKGEVLGFAGLVGAGRTEIMNAILGLDKMHAGEITLFGEKVHFTGIDQAIRKGMVLVPEDRKGAGLVLGNTIAFNMLLPQLKKFIRRFRVDRKGEQALLDTYANQLSIKMVSFDDLTQNLSGGNQQKIVISKWLACQPKVLIMDEPTRGIDVGAKAEIYEIIHQITDQGVSVILISSDLPEIMRLSSRLAVVYEGKLMTILDMDDSVTQEQVMYYAMGGKEN